MSDEFSKNLSVAVAVLGVVIAIFSVVGGKMIGKWAANTSFAWLRLFTIFGILSILGSAYLYYDTYQFAKIATRTQGMVIKKIYRSSTLGTGGRSISGPKRPYPIVSFAISPEDQREFENPYDREGDQIGDVVAICYDPTRPSRAIIIDETKGCWHLEWDIMLIFGGIGLVCLIVGEFLARVPD